MSCFFIGLPVPLCSKNYSADTGEELGSMPDGSLPFPFLRKGKDKLMKGINFRLAVYLSLS